VKNDQLISLIKELGLSDFEARVYLATLTLGPTTILKISRTSGIKRATVYTVIEDLIRKGYISIEPRGFKRLFVAENPRNLEKGLEDRRERFREALPDLDALYNQREGGSIIRIYEGKEAIRGIYKELPSELKYGDPYLVIANVKKWNEADPEHSIKWRERRSKLGLACRLIVEDNEEGRKFAEFAANYSEKVKLLPSGRHLDTSLVITPKKAIVHQYLGPVSVVVNESAASLQMYKEMFELIWESLA
jgi:HTH-type transcriptional regulator, sugar sensing transcriptional regulator